VDALKAEEEAKSSTIDRLERAWRDAHLSGDRARLDPLLATDVLFIFPEMAPMGKADFLSALRSSDSRFIRYDTREIDIRDFGDTVVVFGHVQRTRVTAGARAQDNWRFTKVYVRRNDRWQVVNFHASEIPG
jgi:uncharacterized protein (TIGR02246 family)